MSEPKPSSSTNTGLIVAVVVAAVLGVPCLIGVLLIVIGGIIGGIFYAKPNPSPPPPVPIVRDAEKAMPETVEPETPQVPF